jgi:hypothetical protein
MILARTWQRYSGFWNEREGPESLALLRITVAIALIANLLEQFGEGMVLTLYALPEDGGAFEFRGPGVTLSLFHFLRPTAGVVIVLVVGQLLAALLLLLGLFTRAAAIACYVLEVTLCDRMSIWVFGGDNVLRIFLFLMCLAPAGEAWGLDARWRGARQSVPCWPRRLFIFQLTVVYVATGIMKMGSTWTFLGEWSAGYLSLNLPGIARWPGDWAAGAVAYPLTQLGTALTRWWELTFFVVPLNLWLRRRAAQGKKLGPLRHLLARFDLRAGYLLLGVMFHVGLAVVLDLGVFSLAMLSLYPCLFQPHESRWLLERITRRNGA